MTSGKMVKLPAVSSVSFFEAVYPVTQYPPFQPIHLDSQNLRPGKIIGKGGGKGAITFRSGCGITTRKLSKVFCCIYNKFIFVVGNGGSDRLKF